MTSAAPRLVLMIVLMSPASAAGSQPESSESSRRLDTLSALYEQLGIFNGVVLLAQGDEIVFEKAYGMANYELGVPNGPDSRFRVASLSKPITKIAIGRLEEAGKLSFETRLARFVPEYPHAGRITIQQLLDHRSGVPHINSQPWYERDSRHHISLEQIVERISEIPLDFEPGSDKSYSNGGYALLALVIERASGASYESFLRHQVLDPLGMGNTGHDTHDLLLANRASGYVPGPIPGQRAPAQYVEPSIKAGGGSIYSTTSDLLRLGRAFFVDNVLRVATWEALFEPRDGELWFTGRAPGYYATFRRRLVDDWTLIVLSNNYGVHPIDEYLPAVIGAEPFELPTYRTDVVLDAKRWRAYEGTYQWPEPYGTRIEIEITEGRYATYVELFRDQRIGLVPQSTSSFYLPLYDALCSFDVEREQPRFIECTAPWADAPIRLARQAGIASTP